MTDAAEATDIADTATATPPAEGVRDLDSGVDAGGRHWRRIPLETPIDRHGTKITSVVLKKPLGTDCQGTNLSALHNADVTALSIVLPRVTEPCLSKHEVMAMGIDDLGELGGAVIGFLLTRRVKAELGLTE